MKLKKSELIVCVIFMVAVLVMGLVLTTNVYAAEKSTYSLNRGNTNSNSEIESRNTNSNKEEVPVDTTNTNESSSNTNTNSDTADKNIANTGIEDLFGSQSATWIVIGICVISAIFAYRKVKEYKVN